MSSAPHGLTDDPVDLLEALVATRSLSRQEDEIAGLMCGWLRERGLPAERLGCNVVLVIEGSEPGPTLLLNSHLDTVPPASGWSQDPWTPTRQQGRLTGLGAGDAKGSVAAMACAAAAIGAQGLTHGKLVFAATCCEEVGGGEGLEAVLGDLPPLDAALVGEPTGLQGALAQGGLLIIEACAHGRSAHAARPDQGINALTVAARDLLTLDGLTLDRHHPLLGGSTAVATVLQGGSRHNVIPDRCDYTIDIRYTPAYEPGEIVALLDEALEAELKVRSDRLRPVEIPLDHPLVSALRSAHPAGPAALAPFGSPTMSDWVHLGRAGVPAVKIGPGMSQRSHTADEWIEESQVRQAAALYRDCALGFTRGGL